MSEQEKDDGHAPFNRHLDTDAHVHAHAHAHAPSPEPMQVDTTLAAPHITGHLSLRSPSSSTSRRRHPQPWAAGAPYPPHQRTLSLNMSRQPGVVHSASSRHVRTNTNPSDNTDLGPGLPLTLRARSEEAQMMLSEQDLVQRYMRQFTEGCGSHPCPTLNCASHPDFVGTIDLEDRARESATRGPGELCPRLERTSNFLPMQPIPAAILPDPRIDLDLDTLKSIITTCKQENNFDALVYRLKQSFSNLNRLSMSFSDPALDPKDPMSLKLGDVLQAYLLLQECPPDVQNTINTAAHGIMTSVTARPDLVGPRLMKGILIIFMNPALRDQSPQSTLVFNLSQIVWRSSLPCQRVLKMYFTAKNPAGAREQGAAALKEAMSWIVQVVQKLIKVHVDMTEGYEPGRPCSTGKLDESVGSALRCLQFLYYVNQEAKLIKYTEFYNESLNGFIDCADDFRRFRENGFSLCNFPFVLSVSSKADILKLESLVLMREKLQMTFFRTLFEGVRPPYLLLIIRRDYIIEDALVQLQSKKHEDLKKKLKVKFVDEDGIDEGGVQKEFFQLAMRELLDPKYGMFTMNEESRMCWFAQNPLDDELALDEYNMVGRFIGLAIYNGIILDIHFPLALYKKLAHSADVNSDPDKLDEQWTLEDLWELDPTLAKGMQQLESFEGDVAEAYDRTFQVEFMSFGQKFQHDLVPNGASIPLTNANRHEFIHEYLKFVFTTSVARQFNAFKEGFHLVTLGSAMQLFRPEEVEQLICGSPDLDFEALEKATLYEGGFHAKSRIIRWFWDTVHAYEEKDKKRLLFFATGSDRVPIGGLGNLSFTISKNGPDSMRLPTSHTCYNTLMLCAYSSKERLQERLLTAIGNAEGFGLM